jgi:diguanylate cyclase (GGDEF)-like protein/PAS domain S-box-containing protein
MSETTNINERMLAPLRSILVTITASAAGLAAVGFATGSTAMGAIALACAALMGVALLLLARGASTRAAELAFGGMAVCLLAYLWTGLGTRDYGLAAIAVVLFLGCVFLGARSYWLLAGFLLAGVLGIGIAELTGLRASPASLRTSVGGLLNLSIIIVGSTVGGRALTNAVANSLRREQDLSGQLARSEDRLRKIFMSSHDAIVVTRASDGTYLEVNDAYLDMFGYTREEVVGRSALALGIWANPAERARMVDKLKQANSLREFEAQLVKKSGETIEAVLSVEVLALESGECLVISVADVTARRAAERRAEYLSTRDALTGLPNRALALDRLRLCLDKQRRVGGHVGVLHIDIDRFKAINDLVSRLNGDAILREVARRIETQCRAGDTLARIGGNEFLLIADALMDPSQARELAQRVREAMQPEFAAGGQRFRLTASIGFCCGPGDSADAESLLLFADTAMHAAKVQMRSGYLAFDRELSDRLRDRTKIETLLREAISGGQLSMAYQPKFQVRDGSLRGFEALARWKHPTLGQVPPSTFIPIAEESDLILQLGEWALDTTCRQLATWSRYDLPALSISVNLSARQIDPSLPRIVADSARRHGIDAKRIEFEVTETALMANPEATRRVLGKVSADGSRVVLDDFGVAYSSLNYVKMLDIDGIKIDRVFVRDIAESRHDRAIVRAIVGLARGLGLRVVAEGVEKAEQLDTLRELGCDEAQGYLLGRPDTADAVMAHYLAPAPHVLH